MGRLAFSSTSYFNIWLVTSGMKSHFSGMISINEYEKVDMAWNDDLTGVALNIAQHDSTSLRVMAGPGTGKSFVMQRRVARLLEEGTEPTRILAVTFTRTAAASLVKDLNDLKIQGSDEIHACTLHALCFGILLKRNVLDYLDRVAQPLLTFNSSGVHRFEAAPLLQDLGMKRQFGTKREMSKRIKAFEAAWARLQSEEPGWPNDPIDKAFGSSLTEWLSFHKAMLIGEVVPETLRYLKNNPQCEELNSFEHIIVDEYQDLNKAEQELISLLAASCGKSVVGDVDQSIYTFRHAHPEGIDDFSNYFPDTHDETMTECRRCPTTVVSMANDLIGHNHLSDSEARLVPYPENPPGEVKIVQWPTLEEEVEGLASYVTSLIASKRYVAGDILILSPRKTIGIMLKDQLLAKGVPTHSFYNEEALEDENAQIAFTVLSLLANNSDRTSLRFFLGFGHSSWLAEEYMTLRTYCENNDLSPWDVLSAIADDPSSIELTGVDHLIARFRTLKDQLTTLSSLRGQALIDAVFPQTVDWAKGLREILSVEDLGDADSQELYEKLKTSITQPLFPDKADYVRIMSLHKSKGLTSKVVIVASCLEGMIPITLREGTDVEKRQQIEEQRRLFYVAVTRCREVLIVSSFQKIERHLAHRLGVYIPRGGGMFAATISSRFISELGSSAPKAQSSL